ncbi:MAG TPA: peptide-binding protein [Methylomirabilota bacterium]|nr:peptide-binding protein [Methylomirabilota bacterium]
MRRLAGLAVVLGIIAALAGGCGSQGETKGAAPSEASTERAYGDTFVEASIGDIGALIPSLATDAPSHEVGGLVYDQLIRADKNVTWLPAMAESWQFTPDCLGLTFKLRKDVKWHDGQPFTSEDVVFTWKTLVNPKTPAPFKEKFLQIENVTAPDPYTAQVTYKQPFGRALESWDEYILPKHLLEGYVADGKLRESPQNKRPIGTGPYRFKEWRSGEKVVLVASPDYYLGQPYLSRIVYRVIPSQATIFLELKARGVDYSAGLTAVQYMRQTEYPAFRKAYNKFRYPGNGYTFLAFNLKDPRFADRRVRQAFAHAIDKKELMDGVAMGLAREATGPIRPTNWAYTDQVPRFAFDPAAAKRLLEDAGWADRDGDGIVEDRNGRPFAFTIRTNQGNDERKRIAEIVQQRLLHVGVKVEIQTIDWASFIKEFVKPRKFEAIVLGLGFGVDPDQYVLWHSSQTGPEQMNRTGYANPEVDALLEKGRASCRREDRVKTYHRIQEILAEDLPMLFLYVRDALPVVSSRVHGPDPGPAGMLWNLHEWYVPKSLQVYTAG